MPGRTLSERELNRALLARQLLLRRSNASIPRVLERVCGLQTQYAPSAYIGLWSRMQAFRRDSLTRALERRTVIQGTLMRATIHMVARGDFWPFAAAIDESVREWWLRAARRASDRSSLRAIDRRVRAYLASGPRRRQEIVNALGLDAADWRSVGLWTPLVRVPPSGTWEQRRADLYAVAEDWLGPNTAVPDEGVDHLVKRYLRGFGPASTKDVMSFTGLSMSMLRPSIERLPLRSFRSKAGEELLDVRGAPLPDAAAPAPARFLPTWDATLLVQARRTQILPERFRSKVFNTKTPHSVSTFLVDGRVAGTWRHDGKRIRLEPFEPIPRAARRELEDEARGLAAFHE